MTSRCLLIFCLLLLSCGSTRNLAKNLSGVRVPERFFHPSWRLNTDPQTYQTGNLPVALTSPVVKDGILHLGDGDGYMGAYELDRGVSIWRRYDGGQYNSSPVYFGDNIIYGNSDGKLNARNVNTGEMVYSVALGASVDGTPHIYKGRLYVQLRNHKVVCLDAKTGKILWAYRRSVSILTTIQRTSTPVVYKGKLYVGFADGTVAALSVEEGNLYWERKIVQGKRFIDVDTTPQFFAGNLIMGPSSGLVTLMNPKNGRVKRKLSYSIYRAPLIYNNRMIIGTTSGEVVVLDKAMKEVSKTKISTDAIGPMIFWKGHVVAATTGGGLYSIDLEKGKVVDVLDLGHRTSVVFGHMAVSEGKLALLSSRNRLYVFK